MRGYLIFFLTLVTGCSALTPYKSDFQCPDTYKGKCVSLKEAYEQSLRGGNPEEEAGLKGEDGGKESPENIYRDSLYDELAGLIKEPVTPVVRPPKIMRALVLPYPDKERLYMPRYVFIMVDEPKWVLDSSLTGTGN